MKISQWKSGSENQPAKFANENSRISEIKQLKAIKNKTPISMLSTIRHLKKLRTLLFAGLVQSPPDPDRSFKQFPHSSIYKVPYAQPVPRRSSPPPFCFKSLISNKLMIIFDESVLFINRSRPISGHSVFTTAEVTQITLVQENLL